MSSIALIYVHFIRSKKEKQHNYCYYFNRIAFFDEIDINLLNQFDLSIFVDSVHEIDFQSLKNLDTNTKNATK